MTRRPAAGSHGPRFEPSARPASVLWLAALVACGGDARNAGVTVTDSSGVTIVESTAPAWGVGEGFRIDPDPVLDLAGTGSGPDHEFYGVSDGARLADGTLVLAEGSTNLIKYYAPDGRHLGSFGGEGEGPGEFLRIRSIDVLPGDTVIAYDGRNVRITKIGPDRRLVGETALTQQFITRVVALEPGVTLVGIGSTEPVDSGDGHQRWPRHYVRLTDDGVVIDTVLVGLGSESVSLEGGAVDAVPFLGKDTYVAVHDGEVYLGDSDSLEVRRYTPDGTLIRQARVSGFDLGDGEVVSAAEAAFREEMRPATRRINEMLPVPTHRPAYADILVDPRGYVWTSEHKGRFRNMLDAEPVAWQVFDPDGVWLGAVEAPGRLQVFEIGDDYVFGLWRDDIDVERPVLLRLTR